MNERFIELRKVDERKEIGRWVCVAVAGLISISVLFASGIAFCKLVEWKMAVDSHMKQDAYERGME